MGKIRLPKVGDNINQALTVAVKDINKTLPSLQVNSDLGGTSILHSANGSVIHSKDIHLYPNVNKQTIPQNMWGLGFWNSAIDGQTYELIKDRLTPQQQEEYKAQMERKLERMNLLGLPPEETPISINTFLISKSPHYLRASFPLEDEEIVPGISGAPGRMPWMLEWVGPTVFDNMTTVSVVAPGLSGDVTSTMIYGPPSSHLSATPIACEWHYTIGTTFEGGDGVYLNIHEPLSSNPRTPYYINAPHENGRGLMFWPGQKTIDDLTYNTTYCSGLFWGDAQYVPPTGTSYFYNVYKSINSMQIYPKIEDPQNPGQYIDDTSQSQVLFNLWDLTPCLSCGTSNGLIQNIELVYNADSTGVRKPEQGVNRVITQLSIDQQWLSDFIDQHGGGGGGGSGAFSNTSYKYSQETFESVAATEYFLGAYMDAKNAVISYPNLQDDPYDITKYYADTQNGPDVIPTTGTVNYSTLNTGWGDYDNQYYVNWTNWLHFHYITKLPANPTANTTIRYNTSKMTRLLIMVGNNNHGILTQYSGETENCKWTQIDANETVTLFFNSTYNVWQCSMG